MNLPTSACTLQEDMPLHAARAGDVIVVRPELPQAPVILWRRLSEEEAERMLAGRTLTTTFHVPEPVTAGARGPLRLMTFKPRAKRKQRQEGGAA